MAWKGPSGLRLGSWAGKGGFQRCPEWLAEPHSTCRAPGCIPCFWALGSVLRAARLAESEETGGLHVGWRKPRVTNSPWGREVIAPFGDGVLIIKSLRCQSAARGKLELGLLDL